MRDVAGNEAFTKRAAAAQDAGARIVEVDADEATGRPYLSLLYKLQRGPERVERGLRLTGAIAIPDLLCALRELGIRSVMVEGGARVIRSFLSAAHHPTGSGEKKKVIDALVVTVAPTLVGAAGVGYGTELLADAVRVPNRACPAPSTATDISLEATDVSARPDRDVRA